MSSRVRRNLLAAVIVVSFGLGLGMWGWGAAGAEGPEATRTDAGLRVVCTTGMIGDMVREVGGERVAVTVLMGEGVDPHLFKATRSDVALLASADVVFYNGLLLEGKMTDTLVRIASSGKRVVALTERLAEEQLLEPEGASGHADPHVWMDPTTWATGVQVVRETLAAADPQGADRYMAGAAAYAARIAALDAYARKVLGTVPEPARVLVSAHDAFGYFGRAYGFEVKGIQGISTESEAGVRDVERLVELLVARRIPAVFVESTVSERGVRALVSGAEARGHAVKVGGELYSDAMGRAGTWEGTYLGMIEHNVNTIAGALGGVVPEGGFRKAAALSPLEADLSGSAVSDGE